MTRYLRICLIGIILIICLSVLWGQYDEKQILTQQAQNFYNSRQYAQAETIYKQVLERWPGDQLAILQLLNIAYQTGNIDKAEAILNEHGRYLQPATVLDHELQILVQRGSVDAAWEKALRSLELNPKDQNRYRIIASYFERRGFYDQVLRLYQLGRQQFNNPELFSLEYANSALNYQRYELALREYLRWLDRNPGNLYFINNQCKLVLEADSSLVYVIEEAAGVGSNPVMKELLAGTLVSRKRYNDALNVYKEMGQEKLLLFATEQFNAMNDEVAQPAFAWLAGREADIWRKSQYLYNLAVIGTRNQRYTDADSLVTAVINDSLLSLPQNRWRNPVSYQARKLKAELSLILSRDPQEALNWIAQAKSFARNAPEIQECELEAARLLILDQDYEAASQKLALVTEARLIEKRDHLSFLRALLSGDVALADSLMNEYVITWPEGQFTNDAIYLMMHALALSDEARAHFMAAYRANQLRDPFAPTMLITLFAGTQDEELLILAVEWALAMGDKAQALSILSHDWQDEVSKDYAALLSLFLQESGEEQQRQAREFLRQNPNSVFSPSFRTRLIRESSGRPE